MKNAIILAAGVGERMVPLTYETPKGLLKVFGEPMIERQIRQLLEAGVSEIIVVTGYMPDKFEYLADKYGAKLVYNPEYAVKNNLASLYIVREHLSDTYLLMSDNYLTENIFTADSEALSWFSCPFYNSDTTEWIVSRLAENSAIREIQIGGADAYAIQGPAYFTAEFSAVFRHYLETYYVDSDSTNYYWEHILKNEIAHLPDMLVKDTTGIIFEFENLEELRAFDNSYAVDSGNFAMRKIAEVFRCKQGEISGLVSLKAALTNVDFAFNLDGNGYVFRLPGIGTSELIDRENEWRTYDLLKGRGITDDVVFFEISTGIKISSFIENIGDTDPFNDGHLKESMISIRRIHSLNLPAACSFNIDSMIDEYVKLAQSANAVHFQDFHETLEKVELLLMLKKRLGVPEILCHGDYAHTNLLITPSGKGRVIDWEYSGGADPIMDVSMFAIYAEMDDVRIELCLDYYTDGEPTENEKIRLHLYVALGGFLWCMWGVYKQANGQELGDYPAKMYEYMRNHYNILVALGAIDGKEQSY